MPACLCARACACVCVRVRVRARARVRVRARARMRVCLYARMHVCVCTYARLRVCVCCACASRYLARKNAEAAQERPAFKPTSPLKESIYFDTQMTLSPFPEHIPDPKTFGSPAAPQDKTPEGKVSE
jgi:hypothetical protein